MKVLYDKICYLILPLAFGIIAAGEDEKETRAPKDQTDLLDKEYGVRYANECEGKISRDMMMHPRTRTP